MKIMAINGSPRKNGNSASMLKSWMEGAKSANPNAQTEWVNLYDLTYTGCKSCFACKRKGGKHYGQCPVADDLHNIIPAVYDAAALAIASPIYFGELNAYTRCFLERTLFCKTSYRKNHDSLASRPVPVTMIYTMNCPREMAETHHYPMH